MASRKHGIDVLRVVAPVGIIWIHANDTSIKEWARPCLSFFVVAVAYFGWLHLARNGQAWAYCKQRIYHLAVPFVVWSAIHASLFGVRYLLSRKAPDHLGEWGPLFGTNYHLWFLPYAMGITLFLAALFALWGRAGFWLVYLSLATAVLLGCLNPGTNWDGMVTGAWLRPLAYWEREMPSVLLGIALAQWIHLRGLPPLGLVLSGVVGTFAWKFCVPLAPYFVNCLLGALLTLVGLSVSSNGGVYWQTLARLSFFVYLLHLIPLSMLRAPVASLVDGQILSACLLTVVTWVVSIAVGLLCIRWRVGWPIVP